MSKKSYKFLLKGIKPDEIDIKYGFVLTSNLLDVDENLDNLNITKVEEIFKPTKTPEIISFFNESKQLKKCSLSLIDFSDRKKVYQCFWHRREIPENIQPIGCPIFYLPSQAIKKYFSEISKNTYVIKENISDDKIQKILEQQTDIKIFKRGVYVTDGIFCSVNCCYAYILEEYDQKKNVMYRDSERLLLNWYNEVTNEEIVKINPAPHWKKLSIHGGSLSDEDFYKNLNKIQYTNCGTHLDFVSIGYIYDEKYKL